jgi:hypothetical protein
MDGTFAVAPTIFTQLYVIRVPLGESYVTCVYALMSGKSYDDYKKMLECVSSKCAALGYQPSPSFVMTDFEMSVIRATQDVFGNHVQHKGCNYHLTQCTWRKVGAYTVVFRIL